MKWPIREALCFFVERLREQAREQYLHDHLCFIIARSAGAEKYPAPKIPDLLR